MAYNLSPASRANTIITMLVQSFQFCIALYSLMSTGVLLNLYISRATLKLHSYHSDSVPSNNNVRPRSTHHHLPALYTLRRFHNVPAELYQATSPSQLCLRCRHSKHTRYPLDMSLNDYRLHLECPTPQCPGTAGRSGSRSLGQHQMGLETKLDKHQMDADHCCRS